MSIPNTLLEAIRALPRDDRARLVEQVTRELDAPIVGGGGEPRAIIGMMSDEPELMDKVCGLAMRAREQSAMRTVDG